MSVGEGRPKENSPCDLLEMRVGQQQQVIYYRAGGESWVGVWVWKRGGRRENLHLAYLLLWLMWTIGSQRMRKSILMKRKGRSNSQVACLYLFYYEANNISSRICSFLHTLVSSSAFPVYIFLVFQVRDYNYFLLVLCLRSTYSACVEV